MGRTFGAKDKVERKQSVATQVQRLNAAANSVEKRCGVSDGKMHLKVIKDNTNCADCEVSAYCKSKEDCQNDRTACPLFNTYIFAVQDVMQNPISYLSKKVGSLEIALKKQQMIDKEQGTPITKEMLAATKLAMEAVKISTNAEKVSGRTGRKNYSTKMEDFCIDATAFEVKNVK